MGGSGWIHSETVCLIDYLDKTKRLDNWTLAERQDLIEKMQRELEASGSLRKSKSEIYQRIVHVSRDWTTTDKSGPLALYYYGWEALRERCSRSVLLSDPTGKYIPKVILRSPTTSSNLRRSRSPTERHQIKSFQVVVEKQSSSSISEIGRSPSQSRYSLSLCGSQEAQIGSEHNIPIDAIQDFLQDPDQYLSSRRNVENARNRLITEIKNAVTRLLQASRTLPTKIPHWNSWFQSPIFIKVLSKIYGNVSEMQLLDVISSNYSQSLLNQQQLLRVILGAVISHWIFDKQNAMILKDPTDRKMTSTEIDIARVFPAFYEQSLRREKYTFVKERVGLETLVDRLTSQFFFETDSILTYDLTNFNDGASEWSESLRTVFTTALELDGQLLLWGKKFEVIWPGFGEVADRMIMTAEETQASTQEWKVLATLFPAFIEEDMDRTSMSRAHIEEGLVLRALVLPQKNHEQPATAQSNQLEAL